MGAPTTARARPVGLAAGLLVVATTAVGCPCVDNAVNSSPWLKWQIFSRFGAERVCAEMTKQSAPLRAGDSPIPTWSTTPGTVVGRFFAASCTSQVNDERRTISVQFAGDGYAWTPITRKVGFTLAGNAEFQPDFRKDGSVVYVWFRPVAVNPEMRITVVEQTDAVASLPITGSLLQSIPFAKSLQDTALASIAGRGFTVVLDGDDREMALGMLEPPARAPRPFDAHGDDRATLANESVELHAGMADFLGPFEVDGDARALYLSARLDGHAVDVAVVPRDAGDAWRRRFESMPSGVPLPAYPPILATVLAPGESARTTSLPRGLYYFVIDDSPSVGQVAPPAPGGLPGMLGAMVGADAPARLTYRVAVGDR